MPRTRPAGARRAAFLAVIRGSYLMIVLDISVVITALPKHAVNIAYQLGGSLGLAVLVTVFAAAGSTTDSVRDLFTHRVSVAFTAGSVSLAPVVILLTRPRDQGHS